MVTVRQKVGIDEHPMSTGWKPSGYGSGSFVSSSPEVNNVPHTDSFIDISIFIRSEVFGYKVGITRDSHFDHFWIGVYCVDSVLMTGQDFFIGVGMVVNGGNRGMGWDFIGSDGTAVNGGQQNNEQRIKDKAMKEDLC